MQGIYKIITSQQLAEKTYAITIEAPEIAKAARPGQFLHILCDNAGLLRRPISICSIKGSNVRFIFDVVGKGTQWLSCKKSGWLDVLGPVGNGYDLMGKRILVVGGGIGTPPVLNAASEAIGMVTAVLGFRSAEHIILLDEFKSVCKEVYLTTDDGSAGEKGFVTGPVKRLLAGGNFDSVLACGPRPMLKAVSNTAMEFGVKCQVSLEERMGCGVGACLVCACAVRSGGSQRYAHVCKDGPVFDGSEVIWDD